MKFSPSVLLSLMVALPLCATPAHAEEAIDLDAVEEPQPKGGPGVMVRPFEGPRSKTIRDRYVRALTDANMNLVPADSAKRTLGSDPAPYVEVAKANSVGAFVHGKITMNKKSWTLTLEARSGATGAIVGSDQISSGWLPGLLKSIDKEAKPKTDALLAAARNSASDGDSDETSAEASLNSSARVSSKAKMDPVSDSDSDDGETLVDRTRPRPLVLYAGPGAMMRSFSYSDPILDTKLQELLPHDNWMLHLRVGGTWYPGAHFGTGLLSNFGINAHFIRSLAGTTNVKPEQIPDGAPREYPTVFEELDVGLRARVPMGTWEMGLNFGVGSQQMGLVGDNVIVRLPYANEDEPYPGVVPDIDSTYYRFGGDVVFSWLDWRWTLGAGMRLPNFSEKPGGLRHQRWFPNANASAATVSLGVDIPFSDSIGLLLLADYRQTGIDMNSSTRSVVVNSEADPSQNRLTSSIAGGATDRYVLFTVGITLGLGGNSTKGSTADEPDEPEEAESDEDEAEDEDEPPSEAPSEKDTSNPAFFGEASGSTSTSTAPKAPAREADTSNPDFFK